MAKKGKGKGRGGNASGSGGRGGGGNKTKPARNKNAPNNYSQSTQKEVNRFLQERGAAKREQRERQAMREQGKILFSSMA
jgi:hypothetical protein